MSSATYPFPKEYASLPAPCRSLAELAHSDDAVFDGEFPNRLPKVSAYDCDAFAKGALKRYSGKRLPSADALLQGKDGRWYFIEFKNQPAKNIEGEKVKSKAVGSVTIAALTVGQSLAMREVMAKTVYVVVFPTQDYSTQIGYWLAKQANGGARATLWGLDELVSGQMLSDAYTLTDQEFQTLQI